MAERVVDLFEVIDIAHRQRQRAAECLRSGQLCVQLSVEGAPVGQAGEWVGARLCDQLGILQFQRVAMFLQPLLVPFALAQLMAQLPRAEAQLHQRAGLA
jgi:hypothetical protein